MDKQKQQEAYKNYVKQKTPVHNLPLNMLKAFITGGIICTIGQGILNYCRHLGITWEALYEGLKLVKGLSIYTVWERWQVAHIKQVFTCGNCGTDLHTKICTK